MNVKIGAVRVLDYPPVENIGTLMRRYYRLRMDPEMKGIEVKNSLSYTLTHGGQETVQSLSFISSFNFSNAVVFDS